MRTRTRVLFAAVLLAGGLATLGGPAGAASEDCQVGSPSSEYGSEVSAAVGHARVWRLYQAFFLRQPDREGYDYWVNIRNGGATLSDIAFEFASGPEFRNRYGNLSNRQYVELVYSNVLCRPASADPEGRAYWQGLLDSGALTRWDMMVNFSELREYLRRTSTCHSIYPNESAAVSGCPEQLIVPLASASLSTNGYQSVTHYYRSGSMKGVEVDITRGVFKTGSQRCSVASINANWLVGSQKDGPNPSVLGTGVVDGIHAKGSSDRTDRGIFGLRFDTSPSDVVEVWPGDTLSADDTRLNSVMYHSGSVTIESWHASAESSPYLSVLAPSEIVRSNEWVWAAAGVPLIIDGQTDQDFSADYANDPYTYQTKGHPFVAFDQNTNRLFFGATSSLDVRDLVDWANANGYEDLIKFDGGGSVEYNEAGRAVVAGTSRDIPVWLGIGC